MKFTTHKQLPKNIQEYIDEAFKVAEKSVSDNGHKVGSILVCEDGDIFCGATLSRTKAIGSTCAERMALDQLWFANKKNLQTCITVGTFNRPGWKNSYICTPCGVCLEMFFEFKLWAKLDTINFILPSWDKTKVLNISLEELFPQIGKGEWTRS